MNMSADNNSLNARKGFMVLLDHGNWSIKWKTMLNFLLRAVVAIGLLILLTNLIQRRITIREANNNLILLSDTKARHINDFFAHFNDKVRTFSASRQTIDAFNQLASAFNSIESDNYVPPSVSGPDRMNILLESYYKTEVLDSREVEFNADLKTLIPDDNKQRILQYLYIASNTLPFGMKGNIAKADDGSAYTYMHALYHPEIVQFARQAGVADILFADYSTGYVIYSLKKNLDFATNLFHGPYRNSGLGMAFKRAISQQEQGAISYTDATIYAPALNEAFVFVSTPVFNGSQLIGAIIVSIDSHEFTKLLAFQYDGTYRTESLKSVLVGEDLLYRCDDPEFLANKNSYTRKLRRHADAGGTAVKAEKTGSTVLVQHVDGEAFADALKGKSGTIKYKTETGSTVLCSYRPITIGNLNWILLTQLDEADAMASLKRLILILVIIALGLAVILYVISGWINNSIMGRLDILKNNLSAVTKGEFAELIENRSGDEIGIISNSVDQLNKRLQHSVNYLTELSKGNIEVEFQLTGENDRFGRALKSIRDSLTVRRAEEDQRKKEDEIRNWTNQGIAMFNDIMRTDTNNLEKLSLNIIRNLVQYLSANQGGLFLLEEEDQKQHLNLIATYAFDRQKFLKKRVEIGEGLAGTCVLEKMTILTNRIPDDYMTITSGLGGARPKCLLVVPLKKDEEVLGVLEIASFEEFKPYEVEFVDKVAESIASALVTVKLHLQTTEYLERFQQQAEEMKAQDEELRQNIEELQATHEQMERLKEEENERNRKIMKEMEDYRKLLISMINEVPEKIFLKDDQGRFVIANKPVADNYGKTVDEILGKSDFDFYNKEQAAEYFRQEQEIVKSGRTQSYEEGDPSKYDGLIVRSIKKPFYIEHLGVTGLFGVQFDISDLKRKEYESKKLVEEITETSEQLKAQEEELRQNIEELQTTHEQMERLKEEENERNRKVMKEMEDYRKLLINVLDQIPGKIFVKDHDGKLLLLNSEVAKVYNKTVEELLGTTDFDNHPQDLAKEYRAKELEIITNGAETYIQEENLTGTKKYLKTTKGPFYLPHLNKTGLLGIQLDVTDLIQLQEESRVRGEELLKEKSLLDALLENVPEHIYFKDKESKFIRFSKSMLKLFGLKDEKDLLGKSDFDFFSEEHARPAFEDEQKIISTGKAIIDLEEKEVMEDGRISWVNTTKMPLRDKIGNIIGTFGISKNISKIKNMEIEALELSKSMEKNRKLLIDILNRIPAKIFLKDEKGAFVVVNEAVSSIYNKTPDQIIGTTDFDNHPDEDVAGWRKQELEIVNSGEKTYLHIEKQNGHERYLSTTKAPFILATTGKKGLLGIQLDVTDLKIMEKEVERLRNENRALQKNRQK